MRQLSTRYKLGDRKQIYVGRSLGSQVGRNFTHQRYSSAYPAISIWLCFNREVNSISYGTYVEKSLQTRDSRVGDPTKDHELLADRSLMHAYTVGFRNDGPEEDEEEFRDLFSLLAALYSVTMEKADKIQILNDQLGLKELENREQDPIQEISDMSTIETVMRRDFWEALETKDKKLNTMGKAVADRDDTISKQAKALSEKRRYDQ